jgi:DNA-binding NarL/FixJ family response regulator
MTKILIADDHEVVRRGLRAIFDSRPGYEVVGEAADGNAAVAAVVELKPDVVIMDFSLPSLNGLEATRRIRHECPKTEVMIFTMHDSETVIRDVLQAGARGYVLKSDADGQVIEAVRALANHRPYFSWKVSEALLDEFLDRAERNPPGALTPREREIVQLIAEGNSNKEIARHLGVSIKTVETHRSAAMRKLGVSTTADLVRYAVRNYLVIP